MSAPTFSIECQVRAADSKPNTLRREGQIPATLYGHKGSESISLVVPAKAAELLVRDVKVQKTPIQVSIPELSWSGEAVLQEVQAHPWKANLYHLSFFAKSA